MWRAVQLGAETLQVFSCSPRSWPRRQLDASAVKRFRTAREKAELWPLAVHNNYLINLAAPHPGLRDRSIAAFRLQLQHALALGADFLVTHPGFCRAEAREEGLARVADSLAQAARGIRVGKLMLLLENTAGAGNALGARFEELASIRQLAASRLEFDVGYCLDTAHCLAAGYDVATASGWRRTFEQIETVLGAAGIKLIHANDSKGALGSRLDRHEHIGRGAIGRAGFRRILATPQFQALPFILETPRENDEDDRQNLRILKSLCPRRITNPSR